MPRRGVVTISSDHERLPREKEACHHQAVDKMVGRIREIMRDGVIVVSTDRGVSNIDDLRTLSPGTRRARARKRAGWQGPALASLRKLGDSALISLSEQARHGTR